MPAKIQKDKTSRILNGGQLDPNKLNLPARI